MNIFHYLAEAFLTITARGRRNILKILTLAVGLAVGLVLSSKACFEKSFDDYHSARDRIYYINETTSQEGDVVVYSQTSGGIAWRMKEFFPEIEESTRFTSLKSDAELIFHESDRRIKAEYVILSDSNLFQILDRECVAGNITTSLAIEGNAVISRSLAQKISGLLGGKELMADVIGHSFSLATFNQGIDITISGIFEDFPLNSSYRPDVVISMPTIGRYVTDGSDNIVGNDCYNTLVRLANGTDVEKLNSKMDDFVNAYLPVAEMKEWGVWLTFLAKPYLHYHDSDASSRNKELVLSLVSMILSGTSVLNYILIVVSTSVLRSHELAIRKCLGCEGYDIFKMMFAESFVHTILAAAVGVATVFLSHGFVENLTGTEVSALFTGKPLMTAICIVIIIIIINGLVPAIIFNRIPASQALKRHSSAKRRWKLALLAVEFSAVAFLGVLVSIISLQYGKLTSSDCGFDYNNILNISIQESSAAQQARICDELDRMTFVEDYGFSFHKDPFCIYDGNNVRLPGVQRELFNLRDGYYVDDRYITTMGLNIIEGSNFTSGLTPDKEILIDRSFADYMRNNEGWDQVVGREVLVTGHGGENDTPVTIVGVFENIVIGNLQTSSTELDSRPMAFFYYNSHNERYNTQYPYITVRLDQIDQEKINQVTTMVSSILAGQTVSVSPLSQLHLMLFDDTLKTRNSIFSGVIATLLIALFGLIGYTIDETRRRSKEIAIRRVNGALFGEIRIMFIRDIMKIAIPSTLIGCLLAAVTAQRWEQNFSIQAGMPWWVFLGVALLLLTTVAIISDFNVSRLSHSNPAESIKTE